MILFLQEGNPMYRFLTLFCLFVSAFSCAEEWILLGERKVDRSLDVDVIPVSRQEILSKIQIRISDKPVQVFDLKVHFRNGTFYDVPIQRNFNAGESSRIIDLPGQNRSVSQVSIKYRTAAFGRRKATLQLWGIKTVYSNKGNHHPGKDYPNKGNSVKWEYLGSKDVSRGHDRDVINITARQGSFQAVRLQVTESDIYLKSYHIVFANGENVNGVVNAFISANSYTPTLDLPGRNRIIQKVVLNYSSVKRRGAKVHLWGLQRTNSHNNDSYHKPHNPQKHLTDEWHLLGQRQVDFRRDFDTVHAQGIKRFAKKIQIRVRGQAVQIKDVKVFFENGSFADLSVGEVIREGGRIVRDLPGDVRRIDRIQFVYKSKRRFSRGEKAIVEVWAK